jgi:arginine exporter protein ArgO
MRKQGVRVVLRVAAICAACGIVFTAAGVATLLNATRGGPALAILLIIVGLAFFSLAGYYVWAYRWLKNHPEQIRKVEQQNAEKRSE